MPLSLNRRKKRRERVSNRTKCLGVFALATALNSLAPFFIFQESIRAKRIDELPSTTTKQSRIVSSRDTDFPWDQDNICHVVEDICKTNPFAKKYWLPDEVKKPQWRYFSRERVGNQQRARKQPKLTLDRGEPVISTTEHKMSWNELQKNKCDISKVSNHVVLHGRNIHMIGEYYQRIILPMHHMMEQYMAFSNPPSNDEKKEVQFYIDYRYFDDPKENRAKIWDSQRLYTLGLPFGDNLQTWVDEVEKSSCQCYSRLIFCGYNVDSDTNSSMTSEQKELTLTPDSYVRDNTNKYCNAGFKQTKLALETEQCDIWQKLRMSLIKTYEENNPSLNQDVSIYRKLLITNALRVFSPTFVVNDIVHHDWKIVGLSQRSDRRKWINIKDTLSHCNTRYHAEKIVCVEVNVDRLPTNFVGAYTNKSLSSVQEQMVLFRSLDSLIGIHGSQLTQGVLMERNSIMVEISPWFPTHWGVRVHGDGWSNSRIKPTPMGIMWHNTDINEVGYSLSRDSVLLCRDKSDHIEYNFTGQELPVYYHQKSKISANKSITELEFCLQVTYGNSDWIWDRRDFKVGTDMIEKFVQTFYYLGDSSLSVSDADFKCSAWKGRGERNGFLFYNLWCSDDNARVPSAHHYYHKK